MYDHRERNLPLRRQGRNSVRISEHYVVERWYISEHSVRLSYQQAPLAAGIGIEIHRVSCFISAIGLRNDNHPSTPRFVWGVHITVSISVPERVVAILAEDKAVRKCGDAVVECWSGMIEKIWVNKWTDCFIMPWKPCFGLIVFECEKV
jgi:hypothetical protein